MPDNHFLSATEIAAAVRKRELSVTAVVEEAIDRIETFDAEINAVVTRTFDRARREAQALDRLAAKGEFKGALHGVPVSIKDSFDTAGVLSTGGTTGRQGYIPERDATVVHRLRKAGAIVIGKTNTPELTLSGETNNLIFGRTCNPYDHKRSPGGSSGGSAAAVASGFSALELGSDTGGSIREPAHFCGVCGLKPTHGRVPRTGHIVPYAMGAIDGLTQVGPIARTVDDLYLGLRVISGVDFEDPAVVPAPVRNPAEVKLSRLRIAYYIDNGVALPNEEIATVVKAAAEALGETDAALIEACPPAVPRAADLFARLRRADGASSVRRLLKRYATKIHGPDLNYCLRVPEALPGNEYSALLESVDEVRSQMLSFMREVDLIVCPASTKAAFLHGSSSEESYEHWSHNTVYNLTGWPAVVVRAGATSSGLPIGVQLVARPWHEEVALAAAKFIETAFGGYQPPPV